MAILTTHIAAAADELPQSFSDIALENDFVLSSEGEIITSQVPEIVDDIPLLLGWQEVLKGCDESKSQGSGYHSVNISSSEIASYYYVDRANKRLNSISRRDVANKRLNIITHKVSYAPVAIESSAFSSIEDLIYPKPTSRSDRSIMNGPSNATPVVPVPRKRKTAQVDAPKPTSPIKVTAITQPTEYIA